MRSINNNKKTKKNRNLKNRMIASQIMEIIQAKRRIRSQKWEEADQKRYLLKERKRNLN